MGCVSPKKLTAPAQIITFPKGVLEVEITNAVLLRDTSLILKMNPYVVLRIGNQIQKSLVHKNEGTSPVFNEKFVFYINSDKIPYGRSLEVAVYDHSVGRDGEIGLGIIDIDTILMNKFANYQIKCHISHGMKSAGWIKAILTYKQQFKGKLLIKPKQAILKRKVGMGTMNCGVKLVVGEDESVSKISADIKDNPPHWDDILIVNLLTSLRNGKLSIESINGNSSQQVCYVDLNLQQLCTPEQTQHQFELKHKENHAGTIKFTSMFMSPEEFGKYHSFIQNQENIPQKVENKSLVTKSNINYSNINQSVINQSVMNQSVDQSVMKQSILSNKND